MILFGGSWKKGPGALIWKLAAHESCSERATPKSTDKRRLLLISDKSIISNIQI